MLAKTPHLLLALSLTVSCLAGCAASGGVTAIVPSTAATIPTGTARVSLDLTALSVVRNAAGPRPAPKDPRGLLSLPIHTAAPFNFMYQPVPAALRLTVTGPGLPSGGVTTSRPFDFGMTYNVRAAEPIEAPTTSLDVPAGPNRLIRVEMLDAGGQVMATLRGVASLTSGQALALEVNGATDAAGRVLEHLLAPVAGVDADDQAHMARALAAGDLTGPLLDYVREACGLDEFNQYSRLYPYAFRARYLANLLRQQGPNVLEQPVVEALTQPSVGKLRLVDADGNPAVPPIGDLANLTRADLSDITLNNMLNADTGVFENTKPGTYQLKLTHQNWGAGVMLWDDVTTTVTVPEGNFVPGAEAVDPLQPDAIATVTMPTGPRFDWVDPAIAPSLLASSLSDGGPGPHWLTHVSAAARDPRTGRIYLAASAGFSINARPYRTVLLALDPDGTVRPVDVDGEARPIATTGEAFFEMPRNVITALAVDPTTGDLYAAESRWLYDPITDGDGPPNRSEIRRYRFGPDGTDGQAVATSSFVAGGPTTNDNAFTYPVVDGPGGDARFGQNVKLSFDGATLYAVDPLAGALRRIRRTSADGYTVDTPAGGRRNGHGDGVGAEAALGIPAGITTMAPGVLLVTDALYCTVRKITVGTDGRHTVTTLAGSGKRSTADGVGREASFQPSFPLASWDLLAGVGMPISFSFPIVSDGAGHAIIADGSGALRQVDLEGRVRTLAAPDPQTSTMLNCYAQALVVNGSGHALLFNADLPAIFHMGKDPFGDMADLSLWAPARDGGKAPSQLVGVPLSGSAPPLVVPTPMAGGGQ